MSSWRPLYIQPLLCHSPAVRLIIVPQVSWTFAEVPGEAKAADADISEAQIGEHDEKGGVDWDATKQAEKGATATTFADLKFATKYGVRVRAQDFVATEKPMAS